MTGPTRDRGRDLAVGASVGPVGLSTPTRAAIRETLTRYTDGAEKVPHIPQVPPEHAPNDSVDSDRDARGRFARGNRASVGNGGNAGWQRRVHEAFQEVVTPPEVAEVWRGILRQAKDGVPHAQALVVRYCGAPPTREESNPENPSPLVLFGIDPDAMREGRSPDPPALAAPELPRDVEVAASTGASTGASTEAATRSAATALEDGALA